jgi:prepilin-type processing-associated H-X9-DG protein
LQDVSLYATGNMGGRPLNNGVWATLLPGQKTLYGPGTSTPRHQGGANYVACDGHAIWLRPDQVSSGDDAPAPNCGQGTEATQPDGCSAVKSQNAAGTQDSAYKLTFSGK